jgi:hypothetical protein
VNNTSRRSLIAEATIGLAIVTGAYMTLVDPVKSRLAEARAATGDAARLRAKALVEGGGIDDARAALLRAKERAQALEDAGKAARDELVAFERLVGHATAAGAEVTQIQRRSAAPRTAGATMLSPTSPAGAVATPATGDTSVGFTMSVTGRYEQIVALVDALSHELETTVVESVALTPAGDTSDPRVSARIDTLHIAYDAGRTRVLIEQALARLAEAEAAQ